VPGVTEEPLSHDDPPMPTRAKIVAGLVGCVLVALAAYGMLRVSSPAIRPEQAAPAGHYSLKCALCHTLSTDAKAIEVVR
jgi:hypothetical protein